MFSSFPGILESGCSPESKFLERQKSCVVLEKEKGIANSTGWNVEIVYFWEIQIYTAGKKIG